MSGVTILLSVLFNLTRSFSGVPFLPPRPFPTEDTLVVPSVFFIADALRPRAVSFSGLAGHPLLLDLGDDRLQNHVGLQHQFHSSVEAFEMYHPAWSLLRVRYGQGMGI